MRTNHIKQEFYTCIADLLESPDVQSMDHIKQHVNDASCLDHSIYVAYLSFLFCRRAGLDFRSAARGGLLHDLYLYDWRVKGSHEGNHMLTHAATALKNAEDRFALNDREKDIIVKHMWPLTLRLPKYKESLVVSTADKVCALAEILRIYRLMHMAQRLAGGCTPPCAVRESS